MLIVGLGNPGKEYARTRHNVGRLVIETASDHWHIPLTHQKGAWVGWGELSKHTLGLALPDTWMNLSGESVRALLKEGAIPSDQLVVVHDDLDLPFGVIRIKTRGGSGGHNGVASVMAALSTDRFTRLKVGVGRPPDGVAAAAYVLSPFTSEEVSQLPSITSRAVEVLATIVLQGVATAMNRYHTQVSES